MLRVDTQWFIAPMLNLGAFGGTLTIVQLIAETVSNGVTAVLPTTTQQPIRARCSTF